MLRSVSCWGVELLGARWDNIQSRREAKINASPWSYPNPLRKRWHLIWGKFVIQEFSGRESESEAVKVMTEEWFDQGQAFRSREGGGVRLPLWPHKMNNDTTHLCRGSVKRDPWIKVASGPCDPARLPDRSIHPETAFVWFKCHLWCDQQGFKWSGAVSTASLLLQGKHCSMREYEKLSSFYTCQLQSAKKKGFVTTL